jgi:hypothetical protein
MKAVHGFPARGDNEIDGGLLDYADFGIIDVLTVRCSLLPELLPTSCRCIADILPINYRIEHGGRDRLLPASHL